MNASTLFISEAHEYGNYSLPHVKKRREMVLADSEDRDDDPFFPAGALKSNANEMARYMITQLRKGQSPDGNRVVSSEGIMKTWEDNPATRRACYAIGWETKKKRKYRIISHEGAYDNFCSVVVLLPEQNLGLILLINTESVGGLLRCAPKLLLRAWKRDKR